MSIEKLKSGKFRARVYDGQVRKASSKAFMKRQDAVLWESEYKHKMLREDLGLPRKSIPLSEVIESFVLTFNRRTSQHKDEVEKTVTRVMQVYKLKTASEFTAQIIMRYIQDSDYSPCTLSRRVGILKQFGRYLHKCKHVNDNPSLYIEKPRAINLFERYALTVIELDALLNAMQVHAVEAYSFTLVVALTGMRKREAVTLSWDNIDFDRKIISLFDKPELIVRGEPFRCKRNSSRVIPMLAEVMNHLQQKPRNHEFLLHSTTPAKAYEIIGRHFKKGVMHSGIRNAHQVTPHRLRHTWISHALRNGIDSRTMMAYSGHTNLSTIQKYAHEINDPERMMQDAQKFLKVSTHIAPTAKHTK